MVVELAPLSVIHVERGVGAVVQPVDTPALARRFLGVLPSGGPVAVIEPPDAPAVWLPTPGLRVVALTHPFRADRLDVELPRGADGGGHPRDDGLPALDAGRTSGSTARWSRRRSTRTCAPRRPYAHDSRVAAGRGEGPQDVDAGHRHRGAHRRDGGHVGRHDGARAGRLRPPDRRRRGRGGHDRREPAAQCDDPAAAAQARRIRGERPGRRRRPIR